ncbi:MAG: albusnodin/ikarugamycin family macrolactam cyclase [Nocardiopsaceae bacterium]|nr:albusnodin/ikarugamycin family macrolactam cyclase [Nocardiopsaceae bacterium]
MWIGGIAGTQHTPAVHKPLWGAPRPAWTVGDSGEAGLHVAFSAGSRCRLAIAGDCYATAADLETGLDAVDRHDWRALTSWPGSYWAACDDGQETTVLTDVAGSKPVYYTRHHGGTAWATQAGPLADLTGVGPDYGALAAWMTCPAVPEAYPGGTTYTGVRRLPGGHALRIGRDGVPRVTRYEPEDEHQPFDDAAVALREALMTAVSMRASRAGRLSSDFSGGLDSTTLAILAVRAGFPVLALTHCDPAIVNDDLEYAKRLAAGEDENLLTHVAAGSGRLFFDDLDSAPRTDQPLADTARWAVHAGFRQPVTEHGSDIHMTGSGGDTHLAAGPQALACLAAALPGKSAEFMRHCSARARLRQLPVHSVVRSALALSRTSYEQALGRVADAIRNPAAQPAGRAAMNWAGHGRMAVWLTVDARRQLAGTITAASVPDGDPAQPALRAAWNELREFGTYQAELDLVARGGGVPAHAVLLDNNVVRAAMSIPVVQRLSNDVQKPLLNAAFSGTLPALLLRRPTKGGYDGSGYAGIAANAERLTEMARQSPLAGAGLIDPGPVREEIARMAAGAPGRMAMLEAFVAADRWAAAQDSRHRVRWTEGAPDRA